MRTARPCKLHFVPSLACLALLLTWIAPRVHAEPRSLYIYGALSTEYSAELAQFGNPMDQSVPANLMLPPDNPWLCEYPESLANLTAAEIATKPEFFFSQNVALFVSINRCSAETKARVAAQLRERISDKIKMIILYSTNPQEFKFVSLKSDNDDNPPDLKDIGILYIPHRYASGIDLRMRMQYQGDDPRFSWESSERWNFPIEVTALSANSRPRRSETTGYNGGDIYWFRIILFSLLIASPCCRACYLWYAGGGRLHWRRNERGRIVGIQYIPPMPLWLTTGRPAHDGPSPVGVLTEEEFNNLPEIVYTGVPEKDDSDTDEEDEGNNDDGEGNQAAGNPTTCSNTEVKSGTEEEITVDSDLPTSSEVDLESGAPMTSETSSGTSSDLETPPEEPGKLQDAEFLDSNPIAESVEKVVLGQEGDFLKTPPEEASNDDAAKHDAALTAGGLAQMPEEEIVFNGAATDGFSPSDTEGKNETDERLPTSPFAQDEKSSPAMLPTNGAPASSDTEEAERIPSNAVNGGDGPSTVVPRTGGAQTPEPEDGSEQTDSAQSATAPPVPSMPQEEASNEAANPVTTPTDSDVQAVEPVEGNATESGIGDSQTTSTTCAICIDEFETGERLTLLPRCKHAFHRECIHAWLIERQGCCPLCKTDVLEPDPNDSPGELDLEAPPEQRMMISST